MLTPQQQVEAAASIGGGQSPPPSAQPQGAVVLGSSPAVPAQGLLASAGGQDAAGPMSDQLSDQDLAAMTNGTEQQDPEVAMVIQALEDPNGDPRAKQVIQTMLSMAARRRMAGLQA